MRVLQLVVGMAALWWIRQDPRLRDNAALRGALAEARLHSGRVACVFVAPRESAVQGRASRLWLHHSLCSLEAELRSRYGTSLVCLRSQGELGDLAATLHASVVHAQRRYGPAAAADADAERDLAAAGVRLVLHSGFLLHEPSSIRLPSTHGGKGHFATFSPFYAACQRLPSPPTHLSDPPAASESPFFPAGALSSVGCSLPQLILAAMPPSTDWGAQLLHSWGGPPSEADALSKLDSFAKTDLLGRYERERQFADGRAVSRLSAYLSLGVLSPQRLQAALRGAQCESKVFSHRLVWRDLAWWQLCTFPTLGSVPLRAYSGSASVWASEADVAVRGRAWRLGRTGVPLVDAGMRQLRAAGWMQQSVRMAVAVHLIHVLRVPWQVGHRHFADFLIDADDAINAMMWANAAGAGVDPWGFSPGSARSADPDGGYTRRWCPELSRLPTARLHAPWTASAEELSQAGVTLGGNYPHRLVPDAAAAEAGFAAAVRATRDAARQEWVDAAGYDLIDVPRRALADEPPGAAGTVRVRVYTLSSLRSSEQKEKVVSKPAVAAAAKPQPKREPVQKRVRRVSLKNAPVVGKGAAERDRGASRLRSYANADAADVLRLEAGDE